LLRFQILRRSVEGKHLIRFQSETSSVFEFLRCSVDGAWDFIMMYIDYYVRNINSGSDPAFSRVRSIFVLCVPPPLPYLNKFYMWFCGKGVFEHFLVVLENYFKFIE